MEELNGVTLYWLISIGLVAGYVIELIMGRRGMSLKGNLLCGILGSVSMGMSAVFLNFPGAMLFSTVGSIALLFLVNVFSTEPAHKAPVEIVHAPEKE